MAEIKKFNQAPYFDDFDESKNFLRVLFRPSYAVQTRELNQIQSILQDQIGILGDYSIENNSRVKGGETHLNKDIHYIRVDLPAENIGNVNDYINGSFKEYKYDGGLVETGLNGTILFISPGVPSQGIDTTIYVKYESTVTDSDDAQENNVRTVVKESMPIKLFKHLEEDDGNNGLSTHAVDIDPVGVAAGVILNEGIFYVNKSFIRTPTQLLLLDYYETDFFSSNISVGFIIEDSIIKPEGDVTLLDNATGAPNETAPGAHRHKSEIVFIKKDDVPVERIQDYVELLRIDKGKIAAKPKIDNEFTALDQILARRTYDQSGDYVVSDFSMDIHEHKLENDNNGLYPDGDDEKVVFKISAGAAYVKGFEVRPEGDTLVESDKVRVSVTSDSSILQPTYGTYIVAKYPNVGGGSPFLPIPGNTISLQDSGGTELGTAKVLSVSFLMSENSDQLIKVSIFDINLTFGDDWVNISKIVDGSTGTHEVAIDIGKSRFDIRNNTLVYKLPFEIVNSVEDTLQNIYLQDSGTISGTVITPTLQGARLSTSTSDHVVWNISKNKIIPPIEYQVSGSGTRIEMNDATYSNDSYILIAKANRSTASSSKAYTKTLSNHTESSLSIVNEGATFFVPLAMADIYKIENIRITDDEGEDISEHFILDTGQRDTHYQTGRLVVRDTSVDIVNGMTDIYVAYSYFQHNYASGSYFTVNSYPIDVRDIPTYVTSSGNEIYLGAAIDFRKLITQQNPTNIIENRSFQYSANYYLGRADRLMLSTRGRMFISKGIPSVDPQLPNETDDAITLYTIHQEPYTVGIDNLTINKIEHKVYTAKQISKLEQRLTNVEEFALLTSLEKDIMNEDFENLFKSGFVADNFSTAASIDAANKDFGIAFDANNNVARPKSTNEYISLNPKTSTGVRTHASGVITLNYTGNGIPLISQNKASTPVRIQPYMTNSYDGVLSLIPSSYQWFESEDSISLKGNTIIEYVNSLTKRLISSSTISTSASTKKATNLFNESLIAGTWNFVAGVWRNSLNKKATREQSDELNKLAKSSGNTSAGTVTVSSKVSAIAKIPELIVDFKAEGLKPNTIVYPSFDGIDVSQYVRPGKTSKFGGTTQWDGPLGSQLKTNALGECYGQFKIPKGKFNTGDRIFKLSDNKNVSDDAKNTSAVYSFSVTGELTSSTAVANMSSTQVIKSKPSIFRSNYFDPLAQSFFVDSDEYPVGVFIKSIDIFVAPFSKNTDDIVIELRRMNNGYPTHQPIYPHAVSRIKASSIVASSDSFTPTKAIFETPVFLPSGTEYAFVVMSNSETLSIWCSELGQRELRPGDTIRSSGEIISKQPYLGSMFKSQNNMTWTAEQLSDIKFVINRCSFVNSGNVSFVNNINDYELESSVNPYTKQLKNNALVLTDSSDVVYVEAWGHGFKPGDTFKLKHKTDTSGTYYGIDYDNIFDVDLTVLGLDGGDSAYLPNINGFYFRTDNNEHADATVRFGSDNIKIEGWVVQYTYAQLLSDEFTVEGTQLEHTLTSVSKDNNFDKPQHNIVPDELYNLGKVCVSKKNNDDSITVATTLTTNNNAVSPIINKERLGMVCTCNVINNVPLMKYDGINSVFVRQENSSGARYVQKAVSVINDFNTLKVYLNANLPSNTKINVYYKAGKIDIDDNKDWIPVPVVEGGERFNDDPEVYLEQKYEVTGIDDNKVFTVMFELLSNNPARVPKVKNIKVYALHD